MSSEQPNELHGTTDDVNDVTDVAVTSQAPVTPRNVVLPPISFTSSQNKKIRESPKRRAIRRRKSKGGTLELNDKPAATSSGKKC